MENNKKGCGCGKRGAVQPPPTPVQPENINLQTEHNGSVVASPIRFGSVQQPPPSSVIPESSDKVEFKTRQVQTPQSIKEQLAKKMGMVQSFATALASRGFSENKVHKPVKQLRVLSCFGNQDKGGILPPCEYLRNSTAMPGKHYCGGCGCGDKPNTWLMANGEEYSKLDYPKLNCPLNMPGFANYETSKPDEAEAPITRRYYIEQIDYSEIEKIDVSLPEKEEPPK